MPFPNTRVFDDDLHTAATALKDQLNSKVDAIINAVINSPDMHNDDKVHILGSVKNLENHVDALTSQLLSVFRPNSEEPVP